MNSHPRQGFAEAFAEVQRVQNIIIRAGPLQKLIPLNSYYRGIEVINKFVTQYIDLALQLSPEDLDKKTQNKSDMTYTFLHELAAHTRDPVVIRVELVAVLLAGRDTTAGTLSWTMYELGRTPRVMAALRKEIVDTIGLVRPPTFEDLKSMKYLQNVMSEILRLYPAVPFSRRLALHDTTLPRGGGPDGSLPLAVLKDTIVAYSPLLMQRRKDLYPPVSAESPDPERFVPERWTTWQPKPWHYIPFNGGPRICIGQQFALAEMGYTLVRIFQRFEKVVSHMDEIDGGVPTLKAEIVLQPGDGVRCAFWEAEEK
jgi:cytochrome P450